MKYIDDKILRYCGIYETKELTEKEKRQILAMKKELEQKTGLVIQKIYAYGKGVWGKKEEEDHLREICFLVDERRILLDETTHIVEEYTIEKNISNILFLTLCQFEKRKQSIGEKDYYIAHYGVLVYDSKRDCEVDERIGVTEYESNMTYYRNWGKYSKINSRIWMSKLIQLYISKIGYYVEDCYLTLEELFDYLEYISNDHEMEKYINNYRSLKEEGERKQLCLGLEEYVKQISAHKMKFQLQHKPTMHCYERLQEKKKEGKLDFSMLTKEDLYTMYILEGKTLYDIACLYEVEQSKLEYKKKKWNIKLKDNSLSYKRLSENIEMLAKENPNKIWYLLRKFGIMNFESCNFEILNFMKADELYLLKEFWKYTKIKEKTELEEFITGDVENSFYRAELSIEFLKENKLIEEVEFKKYRITNIGRRLKSKVLYRKENTIDMYTVYDILGKVKVFGIEWNKEEKEFIEDSNIEREQITEEIEVEKQEKIEIEEQIENLKEISYVKREKKKRNIAKKERKAIKRDYVKEEETKINFGRKCEKMVYEYEKRKLNQEGRRDLEVRWISDEEGDGKGYDIESYEKINGQYKKIYIEVKGTSKDYDEPFEITENEIACSKKYQEYYYLYRVAKGNTKYPIFYKEKGDLTQIYQLEPIVYRAHKIEK